MKPTREELSRWARKSCPGGPEHEGEDDGAGFSASDCFGCIVDLVFAAYAKGLKRAAVIVGSHKTPTSDDMVELLLAEANASEKKS